MGIGIFCASLLAFFVVGVNADPVITDVSALDNRFLNELFPVGNSLGKILAIETDGKQIQFFLSGNGGEYFRIDRDTGEVFLKKDLDAETDIEIRTTLRVVTADQSDEVDVKSFVNDENDNEPYFDDYGISLEIAENATLGLTVTNIVVQDLDTKNDVITLTCNESSTLFQDACDKFELVQTVDSNKVWRGSLVLRKELDYEQRNSYAIKLTAFDGKYYEDNEIHVELQDINDTPPRFTNAVPSTINEEEPLRTPIQTVRAVDQDETDQRAIVYELIGDNTGRFTIGTNDGILSNGQRLDFDSIRFPKNTPFELTIKAREVYPNGTFGNDPLTTATVKIKITVNDINDNTPTFDETTYTAIVDENIVSGANVPGLQMTVTDIDSGTFNSFDLVTLAHKDIFDIIPNEDSSSSSATLYVVDGRKIDFESGVTEYIIPVEARQTRVPNPTRTGTTTVTINVRNINDITPTFPQETYRREISELAAGGELIIDLNATDPEAGDFGVTGIKYRLYGNIPEHFTIDEDSGVIRVKQCPTPGEGECIDYERKPLYTMTVSATDNKERADGRTRSVQLIVAVLDRNDVTPAIEDTYIRYIREGEQVTINSLVINPVDPDTRQVNGELSYQIEADSTNLWQVTAQRNTQSGLMSGNVTAKRPILYEDAPLQGQFRFVVVVSDTKFSSRANVIINVIDINNNDPKFVQPDFIDTIREDTKGEVYVTTVSATDGDDPSTGNGVLDISISGGDRGKFYARQTVLRPGTDNVFEADIYTTAEAAFNYDTEPEYNMNLVVRDRGTPESRMGTGKLKVIITDINNKNPTITPAFATKTVSENTRVGVSIHQVIANDADDDKDLRYSFTPQSATDGNGGVVDANVFDFGSLFRIDELTGEVFVKNGLDRDRTASVTYNLKVQDVAANPVQEGTGLLLIHITEFNDQPPKFNTTHYRITINEELNINSFIQNLYCTDTDDKIDSYLLEQERPRRPTFFSLFSTSGAMMVESRIDYDEPNRIEMIELTARCVDTGNPPLTATAQVTVTINNINDNYPIFEQPLYRTTISEGTQQGGELGVNVKAFDLDRDDYGEVRYSLVDADPNKFTIDPITGKISVTAGSMFDRETEPFVGIQVRASDSPLDATVRKESTVPVYITIADINDNCPEFSQILGYSGVVPESAERDTSMIDVLVTDADSDINARIRFTMKSGSGVPAETESLFRVRETNGRVLVRNLLKGKAGSYRFTLVATDMGGDNSTGMACSTETTITIQIQESLNSAPRWVRPPRRDYVIYVLESQYEGMLVYNSKAVDDNVGPSGVVDYHFMDRGQLTQNTVDFRINRVTGVIRAEVIFDREQKDTYFLTLMARDRGVPAASSETTLTIKILDVDDNDPIFPMKDGEVSPLLLPEAGIPLLEGQTPPAGGYYLGSCTATDADSDQYNKIEYQMLAAEDYVRNHIRVNSSCGVFLMSPVDFDSHPTLEFDVLAFNENNDDSVIRYRVRRAVNPSIQHVIVRVTGTNDNQPEFNSDQYRGCIASDAPFNQTILVVSATDKDVNDVRRLRYSLTPTSQSSGFAIDPVLGILYNTRSFRDDQRVFDLEIRVQDDPSSTPVTVPATVFVTHPEDMVKVKIERPLSDVQPFSQQLLNSLTTEGSTVIAYACIDRLRNHIDDDGEEVLTATDMFVTGVRRQGNSYSTIPADELAGIVSRDVTADPVVSNVEVDADDDGFTLEEDAVLAILIISILLIVLALMLVCIACYCIRKKDRKKKRQIRESRRAVHNIQEPTETSFNPVYDNKGDCPEDIYSTVSKVRPGPITPVMIPAPQNLQPLASEVPPQDLQPVVQEEDVPVIETEVLPEEFPEVLPEEQPSPQHEEPIHQLVPEYEDRIETEVVDELESPVASPDYPPPPPAHDDSIEVVIEDSLEAIPPPADY